MELLTLTDEVAWTATGLETPVFDDPTGRRARAVGGLGAAAVAVTLAALVIVVTAAIGFSSLPAAFPPLHGLVARTAAPAAHGGVQKLADVDSARRAG